MSKALWVGSSVPQIDIEDKLRGRTAYLADVTVPGMLHGAIVRSPVPHGRLLNLDVSRASEVPGVRAIATAVDAPEVKFGPYAPDWEILARYKVRHVGDEVAAIAATTAEAAQEAVRLVRLDIEELPAVFDPLKALADGAPQIWDDRPGNVCTVFDIERGDVDAAFDRADLVMEDTYETNRIYHGYLEPLVVIADYQDGCYLFRAPSHIPYRARLTYAAALGVPLHRVQMIVPPIGGSFGAKYEMDTPLIAALLARKAGAPVRILFDREEDAASAHPRPPFIFRNRIAVAADGTFLGREVEVTGVAGARTYWSPTVLATAVHRIDAIYNFRAMSGHGRLVYTNENPTTCMRGFGNAEALFGIEQMIDQIADRLHRDPIDLRLQNTVREGQTTLHGWKISSCKLPDCLRRVDEMSGFSSRRRKPGDPGPESQEVLRGMGLAIGHHVSGYKTILADYDGSSAILRLGGDGSANLYVGEPDIGQGHHTALCQIAAELLAISPHEVRSHGVDSSLSPAAVGTLASRALTMAGMAVVAAAEDAVSKLAAFLAVETGSDEDSVRWDGSVFRHEADAWRPLSLQEALYRYSKANCGLPLLAQGVHRPPTEFPDDTKYGNPSAAYPFAAHVAEVEVDRTTGQVDLLGYWAAHDSGTIVNPATARGQVAGGVAQGIGWALMEDVSCVDGRVLNPNFLDYRIPGAGDIPVLDIEFVEGYEPNGPLGAKSVGEVAINPVAAAIANAVQNATGRSCNRLPFAGESLWRQLQEDSVREESPSTDD